MSQRAETPADQTYYQALEILTPQLTSLEYGVSPGRAETSRMQQESKTSK